MNTETEYFRVGQTVRYHPIIGGPHDGREYTVRDVGDLHGRSVAWLVGKAGCVTVEALSREVSDGN